MIRTPGEGPQPSWDIISFSARDPREASMSGGGGEALGGAAVFSIGPASLDSGFSERLTSVVIKTSKELLQG